MALLYCLLASHRSGNSEIGYILTHYSQRQSLKTTRLNMMKSFLVHPAATSSTGGRLKRNAAVLVLTFAFLCAALASGKTLREPHAEAGSTCPCQVTLTGALITREVALAKKTHPHTPFKCYRYVGLKTWLLLSSANVSNVTLLAFLIRWKCHLYYSW